MVCAITQMVAYTCLFSPGSTIEQGRDTVFQRKEHFELHALALTQNFRKSLTQYIYLRSFLKSLLK